MRKRLLFALAAMCVAVSGFALEKGEFVYTPQGRFQITEANVASSNFTDFTGWTVVSASETKMLADNFNINANGYADGINSAQSLDATAGEGMYFKFEPTDASGSYVVSFKMKGAAQTSIRTRLTAPTSKNVTVNLSNVVRVAGNSAHTYGDATDELIANTAEELTENWQTFNYAIQGDGTSRTYFISFTGIATSVEIADLQIAPAIQFADLRQRDAMLTKLKTYAKCYNWEESMLDEYGMSEAIVNLEAIGDKSGQADLDELLETAQEVLGVFLDENMDDYTSNHHLGIKTSSGNLQKQSTIDGWTCVDRGFWSNNAYPDLGHYQAGNTWANGNPGNAMGVTLQKTLDPGTYVFSIESTAALREPNVSGTWTNDDGMKPAYAVVYVVKMVDGVAADTVVSVVKGLEPVKYTPFIMTAKVTEAGTYEFGLKAYCKEEYKALKNGSVTYVANAYIWGKNENKYNQKQLEYETDVREQITTGRTNLTTAAEYLASEDYFWGKAELQACVDTVETKIAKYEQMDQDAIIATYEDYYVNSTSDSENGLLVYEVYQEAVKDIIAANKKFVAVNDTLNMIQAAIDNAEATMALRLYDAATGKDALTAAISKAKDVQAEMKASQYSEENAAAIKAAVAELNEAIETFKNTVPASAIATIVDIDFEKDAVLDEETGLYSITGNAGSMEFSTFYKDQTEIPANPFQQGIWLSGEQLYKGYVRVGNGTGTVKFDPTVDGSMGTNILKVNFDFFLQGLSGRYVGAFLKNETGDETVAGFYYNFYDNTTDTNTFNILNTNLNYGSGSNYNDAAPEGAEGATGTTCPKNSFEFIFDYGEKKMYATTTSAKGTFTTEKIALNETIPYIFELKCNYANFDSRRVWFDNLKIQRITAGTPTGIETVKDAVKANEGVIYNLAGQKVSSSFKGIVIMNGKKVVLK